MEIKEITNKKEWEEFILLSDKKTFLHSWNWGEFQKSLDEKSKIWRFGIYDENKLVAAALAIKHIAKRGKFLLVPHGPIFMKHETLNMKQVLTFLLKELKKLAKDERVDFIRISPILERNSENQKIFKDLGFRLRPLHTHPESSWKLNIEKPEEGLLKEMRKTTRYLIKQAEKNQDLKIFKSQRVEDVETFYKMHLEVVRHQKFIPFSLEYLKKEYLQFRQDNQVEIFFAKYKEKVIAASYVIFCCNQAFYHHAALLPEYKKIPAAYLLQWQAIKDAKNRGCKVYDFWGYSDPVKNPRHPYSGPTLFKMGFGGYKDEYVKTQDYIISSKYWFNYFIEMVRRIKRGL